MITPAYAATATERVLPRLALDFTTGILDPRVTVARALNTATRINSSGYIESVNANLPRFDYDPVTLAPKGLLIEETRTNYITNSQNFTGSDWVADACNLFSAAGISPDGTNNAFNCVPDTTVANHRVRQLSSSAPASGGFTSYFVKANGYNWAKVRLGATWLNVNLNTGAPGFTNLPVQDFRIYGHKNGWWRIAVYNANPVNAIFSYVYPLSIDENSTDPTNWAGDGTSGILIYGAQTEIGTFPTSYIPTTTTSLTRNADAVSMTGTNFSSWYNASEGAFVVEASTPPSGAYAPMIQIDSGSSANRIAIGQTASGLADYSVVSGGAAQASFQTTTIADSTASIAGVYKTDSFARAVNGGAASTDNLGSVPTVNNLKIGSNLTPLYFNRHIKKISFYNQRILNAEATAFSKL